MFKFSRRSLGNLATCHPALQAVAKRALELSPVDFIVTEGYRGREAQEAAYKAGRSRARFGKSSHNHVPSLALDFVPYPVDWEDESKFRRIADAFKKAAVEFGVVLRWGGEFKTIHDTPHIEIDEPVTGWQAPPASDAPPRVKPVPSRAALADLDPTDLMSRVIWGECRGVDRMESRGIAHVIVNRANKPRWWGRSVKEVCLTPLQFSCLNTDDPNLPKILKGDFADGDFATCRAESEAALAGASDDPTDGAIGYHAKSMRPYPTWTRSLIKTAELGGHLFYREVRK